MDLRTFATGTAQQSNNQWIVAGKAKINRKGEVGARLNLEVHVKFSPEGHMIIKTGSNNTLATIKPEIRDKVALYNIAGTTLTVSLEHIANVLLGAPNAYAIVNAPPIYTAPENGDSQE